MRTDEKDWIVDVLCDVQKMLEINGLAKSAEAITSTIQFSLLEIANMDSYGYSGNDENAISNIIEFPKCNNGRI